MLWNGEMAVSVKKPGVRGMESTVLRSDLGAGCGVEKGEETAR